MSPFARRDRGPAARRRVLDRPAPWRSRILPILLLPVGLGLHWIAARSPAFADAYSGSVFPPLSRALGALTGWIPFSVAEVLALVLVLWLLAALWRNVRRVRRRQRRSSNILAHAAVNLLALIGLVYGGGMLLWGVLYHRTPLAERAGYDTSPAPAEELRALCLELIDEANAARGEVHEDNAGVMRVDDSPRRALGRVWRGYHRASQLHEPLTAGASGPAKGFAFLSTPMSYLGASGIYVMFTGEPSVNLKLPDPGLLFAACHELAHQRGFAREEEANFAGWLACADHPDADFRYSARLAAMRHALAALYRADPAGYGELVERCSPGVRRDWDALRAFRRRYESRLTKAGRRAYDLFLKSQGQEAGIASYGMMVDLLIAHRRRQAKR